VALLTHQDQQGPGQGNVVIDVPGAGRLNSTSTITIPAGELEGLTLTTDGKGKPHGSAAKGAPRSGTYVGDSAATLNANGALGAGVYGPPGKTHLPAPGRSGRTTKAPGTPTTGDYLAKLGKGERRGAVSVRHFRPDSVIRQEGELRARLEDTKRRLGPRHRTVKMLTREIERLRNQTGPVTATAVATGHNTEQYAPAVHNPFVSVEKTPLSTFSIDVDTASYANVRRLLAGGRLPPAGAVRIEEMVNYFSYDYAPPAEDEAPFAVHVDVAGCPWAAERRLVRIGLKGRVIEEKARPACNLVFLLDVSGSMRPANKLPLFKKAMKLLVERLDENDSVGIVTYASNSGVALEPTSCDRQDRILNLISGLSAGGSTNGAAGIKDAYRLAAKAFVKGGLRHGQHQGRQAGEARR
jgi:hypothetical protein